MRFPEPASIRPRSTPTVSLTMRRVLYALAPGAVLMTLLFGWGVLFNLLLAAAAAVACEALMLRLRGHPVSHFLRDWSAVVTAVLLALALPPLLPWWMPVLGIVAALVLGKHLYGGLGHNPFNPAMVGYVVLLVSFPRDMTVWIAPVLPGMNGTPGFLDTAAMVFLNHWPAGDALDAMTQATPLDHARTSLGQGLTLWEIRHHPAFGMLGGRGWEWINLLFLAGGLWMLRLRVVEWRIPAGVLAGLFLPALVFWAANGDQYASPLFHLFTGGAMLCAFFIATDPVSAATTPRGRLYYGIGIGILIWVIRTWGGYPDGIAFAVLLMNMTAPLLDRYTAPRTYGHRGRDGKRE